MNKKGVIFMGLLGIAFITAILVFAFNSGNYLSGGDTSYIGEKEINLFQVYQEAEEDIYYIELAARNSLKTADPEDLENTFAERFTGYLTNAAFETEDGILSIEDYALEISENKIVAKTNQQLVYSGDSYTYKVTPNFKVVLAEEGVEVQVFIS